MKAGSAKRIVVKVGTSTLTKSDGVLDSTQLKNISTQIAALSGTGYELALVSSGAIRVGMARLGLETIHSLRQSQAAAAVGQGLLMHMYQELFRQHNLVVAQILLSAQDFRDRRRYLNSRNTFFTLFEQKALPIINENDTVAVEEIKFGDNDNLAAQVTGLINAGMLIFLSDVEGLFIRKDDKFTERVSQVQCVTPEIESLAGTAVSKYSRGGMISKINGARIATEGGAHVFIANGREENVLQRLLAGEDLGTHFHPQTEWLDSRRRWIGMSSTVAGTITVDAGAGKKLISPGASLLAAGIVAVKGTFRAGDIVCIVDTNNHEIGRGLSNYNSEEIEKIKGMHSRHLSQVLGYRGDPEVVHRNNMFTFKGSSSEIA
jgi:glutamate 5-kinase